MTRALLPLQPAALRLDQAAAYCNLSAETFKAVCPVKPIEFTLSSRGHRWLRVKLDEWLASIDTNDAASPVGKRLEDYFDGGPGAVYNIQRHRQRGPRPYPDDTLGALVAWFTDPEQCPEFKALSDATWTEYKDRLAYLERGYDARLDTITTGSVYKVRDQAAKDKWPAFADKMVTAMSSMFTASVKRQRMPSNPALGVERIHQTDPNPNREWRPEEFEAVIARAPVHLRTAYMLALCRLSLAVHRAGDMARLSGRCGVRENAFA